MERMSIHFYMLRQVHVYVCVYSTLGPIVDIPMYQPTFDSFPYQIAKKYKLQHRWQHLPWSNSLKHPLQKDLGHEQAPLQSAFWQHFHLRQNISFLSSCGTKTELEWNDSRSVQTRVLYQNRRAWCIFWSLFEAQVEKELLFQQACERNHVVLNSCSWKLGRGTLLVSDTCQHLPLPGSRRLSSWKS